MFHTSNRIRSLSWPHTTESEILRRNHSSRLLDSRLLDSLLIGFTQRVCSSEAAGKEERLWHQDHAPRVRPVTPI